MSNYISIFGKKVNRFNFFYYMVFIILFSIYIFFQEPYIKKIYFENEIQNFQDNYFWKVYIITWLVVLAIGLYFARKSFQMMGNVFLFFLLCLVVGFFIFEKFVTTNALYINQLHSKGKEEIVFDVIKMDNLVTLDSKIERNNFVDTDKLKYIDEVRQRNHQESMYKKKNGDTIKIVFDKGIFGFNYLK